MYVGTPGLGFRVHLEFQVTSAPQPVGNPKPAINKRVGERSRRNRTPRVSEARSPSRTTSGTGGRRSRTPSRGFPGRAACLPRLASTACFRAGHRQRGRAGTAAGTCSEHARGAAPSPATRRKEGGFPGRLAAAAAAAGTRKCGAGCWELRACVNAAAAARDSPEVGSWDRSGSRGRFR